MEEEVKTIMEEKVERQLKRIEEEKKIELTEIKKLYYTGYGHADYTNTIPKINEIIDYLKAKEERESEK